MIFLKNIIYIIYIILCLKIIKIEILKKKYEKAPIDFLLTLMNTIDKFKRLIFFFKTVYSHNF